MFRRPGDGSKHRKRGGQGGSLERGLSGPHGLGRGWGGRGFFVPRRYLRTTGCGVGGWWFGRFEFGNGLLDSENKKEGWIRIQAPYTVYMFKELGVLGWLWMVGCHGLKSYLLATVEWMHTWVSEKAVDVTADVLQMRNLMLKSNSGPSFCRSQLFF